MKTLILLVIVLVAQCFILVHRAHAWGGPSHSATDPVTFGDLYSAESSFADSINLVNAGGHATTNAQQGQINDLNSRVDKLEGVKTLIEGDIRLYDGKRIAISLFNSYDVAHSANFAAGTRITLKLGSSYEERKLETQAKQIAALEAALAKLEAR